MTGSDIFSFFCWYLRKMFGLKKSFSLGKTSFTMVWYYNESNWLTPQLVRILVIGLFTSNRPEVSCKKGVLKNFAKFTWKHLCQSLVFNKVSEACNFIKKKALAQVFSYEFCEVFKNTFFIGHLWWLLLAFQSVETIFVN